MKTTTRYVRVPRTIIRSDAHMDPEDRSIGTALQIGEGVRSTGVELYRLSLVVALIIAAAVVIRLFV